MKKLIAVVMGAVLALGLFAPSARAGSTSAVWVDTRAFVLAEILPEGAASCEVKSGADCAYLTTTFNANVDDAGTYELPDDMGPIAFDLNGRTWTGKAGADGTSATAGGDGNPVFQIGSNTTVVILKTSGSIIGGKGGDGNPAGKGAYAFVDATGGVVAVSDPCELVKKGADGKLLPPSDWLPVGENAYLYTQDGVGYIVGSGSVTNLPAGFDRNSITNAVVEDGIAEIGAHFFKKCRKLNAVTLGTDVESVGTNAFYLCVALERIKVGNAAAVESLEGAVVYQTAIDKDGKPYAIPYIDAPGYQNVLYATDDLANPVWQPIDPKEAFADGAPARFFKFVLEPITIR